MKRRFGIAFGALLTAASMAACNGGYAPPASHLASQQVHESPVLSLLPAHLRDALRDRPDVTIACNTPVAKIPGTYSIFFAVGNVKGSSFASVSKGSVYLLVKLAKSTSPPVSPVPSFSPSPAPNPLYLYYGTFAINGGKGGCAFLLTTQNGKPLPSSHYNGVSVGLPKVTATHYKGTVADFGTANVKIGGLSASGGHGTVTLTGATGAHAGTIALAGRVSIP